MRICLLMICLPASLWKCRGYLESTGASNELGVGIRYTANKHVSVCSVKGSGAAVWCTYFLWFCLRSQDISASAALVLTIVFFFSVSCERSSSITATLHHRNTVVIIFPSFFQNWISQLRVIVSWFKLYPRLCFGLEMAFFWIPKLAQK